MDTVLGLNANRVTPVERLVDAAWDTAPPATARAQVQIHISALLECPAGQLDTEEFGRLVRQAKNEAAATLRARLHRPAARPLEEDLRARQPRTAHRRQERRRHRRAHRPVPPGGARARDRLGGRGFPVAERAVQAQRPAVPTEGQWNNPDLRKWLEPLQNGAAGQPYDRVRISRVIRDLYRSDRDDRISTFEQFNGSPLLSIRMFTMKRAEVSPTGEISDLARTTCAIAKPDRADKHTVHTQQADYARRLDSGNKAK